MAGKYSVKRCGWINNTKIYYHENTRWYFLPWFKRMTEQYKQRGIFPAMPTDIAYMYEDPKDKEAALFASLLIPNGKNLEANIREVCGVIGRHPYEFMKEREYVLMSVGDKMNKFLLGTPRLQYWRVSKIFDSFAKVLLKKRYTVKDIYNIEYKNERAQVMAVVMMSEGGIGMNLRKPCGELRCPYIPSTRKFMQFLIGDEFRHSEFQDLTKIFFDDELDFFYAYLAWEELKRLYPMQMAKLTDRYSRYIKWVVVGQRWKKVLFDFDFSLK